MTQAKRQKAAPSSIVAPEKAGGWPGAIVQAKSWVKATGAIMLVRLEIEPIAPCSRR